MSHSLLFVKDVPSTIPSIVALWQRQEQRQRQLDPCLHPERSAMELEDRVQHGLEDGIVILGPSGRVRGYVQPGIWPLPEMSLLHAFLTSRNGITQALVLSDPQDDDAHDVAEMGLLALATFWHVQRTTGELIRWPSHDRWLEPLLLLHGFALDSVCALRREPLPSASHPPSSFTVRHARPEDEEALVALFEEELTFHEHYTPFVRKSPRVLRAFRAKLACIWEGRSLVEGAPAVLVADAAGAVIGMAENTLVEIGNTDEPGFTPSGHYGCLDNVCVTASSRGQGVGRHLVQASFDMWTEMRRLLTLDGYLLWYNPDNPSAAHFWSRCGFEPLWTTYQRLHAPSVK
ncbi:GNAT family N-acetyltransferase [Ktedonospora formicarum]|uniref:N-acetyltransferase domain-containing protein n=1 Tax=Ktedonospora formicarum TaxID=2778364 RepID=A0A8J3I6H4_9CHLR|nr:GNAT family N-acetyltransferase [Ktedonospora formicarum]GHO46957.1 hypothetical protein KSX_51200 [Ktedonospora formicarum]